MALLGCVTADQLDPTDELFDSFRRDYPNWDEWFDKCRREQRVSWIVDREVPTSTARYGGVCIVHAGNEGGYGWKGRAMKICSLKVSEPQGAGGWGTVLVQKAVHHAVLCACSSAFVEVYPKYTRLLALLIRMGFTPCGQSIRGETVLRRELPTWEPL